MWVEYVHNTLCLSATGMSSFECQFGYIPPLFPEQVEVGVPSALRFIGHRRRLDTSFSVSLSNISHRLIIDTDLLPHCVPARVWLSTKNLPLQVESRKLSQHLTGPLRVARKVNPVIYHLPRSLKINLTFHVSLHLSLRQVDLPLLLTLLEASQPTWSTGLPSSVKITSVYCGLTTCKGHLRPKIDKGLPHS